MCTTALCIELMRASCADSYGAACRDAAKTTKFVISRRYWHGLQAYAQVTHQYLKSIVVVTTGVVTLCILPSQFRIVFVLQPSKFSMGCLMRLEVSRVVIDSNNYFSHALPFKARILSGCCRRTAHHLLIVDIGISASTAPDS